MTPPPQINEFNWIWQKWLYDLWVKITAEDDHRIGDTNEPAFAGTWVNYDSSSATSRDCRFYKDGTGRVHLAGVCKDGAVAPSNIFTLPAGYRPETDVIIFPVTSNNAFGVVTVQTSGVVRLDVGNVAYVSLDGISFKAVN